MRRIIAVLSIVTLSGCTGENAPETRADAAAPPAVTPATAGDAARTRSDDVALKNVVFVGTSLTAGYGVGGDAAFPALIERRIREADLPFRVTNAGISGETSAGGLRRIDWVLQNPVDVLVLELGANDGLRGLDPDTMRSNLRAILTRTRARYPDAAIVLVGMEAPPNLGDAYTTKFRRTYGDLAQEFDATLLPFLLQDVAGVSALNQSDGIHPNEQGHRRIADHVWRTLQPILQQRAAPV